MTLMPSAMAFAPVSKVLQLPGIIDGPQRMAGALAQSFEQGFNNLLQQFLNNSSNAHDLDESAKA